MRTEAVPSPRFLMAHAPIVLACLTSFGLFGCALTSKADALVPRFYEPELPERTTPVAASAGARGEVRIGRISAASHLRDRRVIKKGDSELEFDDGKRWTERPDAYLRRALAQALYEEEGIKHAVSGVAPVLDCELLHFEEIHESGRPQKVRIGLVYALHDDRTVLVGETFTVSVPIEGLGEDATVHAFEKALRSVVDRIVTKVAPVAAKNTP